MPVFAEEMNDASMALWMALQGQPTQPQTLLRARDALRSLIAHPDLDPNAEAEGHSLLMLAIRAATPQRNVDPPVRVDILIPLVQELIERGANPWKPVVSRGVKGASLDFLSPGDANNALGLGAFVMALRSHSWDVVGMLLSHSERPDFDTLLKHPVLFGSVAGEFMARQGWTPQLIGQGLPVNWTDETGRTLLFHMSQPDRIREAVALGMDPHHKDAQGHTAMTYRDSQGLLSTDERAAWTKIMGPQALDDRYVWSQALTGKIGQVKPLFENIRQMHAWRMTDDHGVEVGLLDAACLKASMRMPATSDQPKPEVSLLNHLIRKPDDWPEDSWLMARMVAHGLRGAERKNVHSPKDFEPLTWAEQQRAIRRFAAVSGQPGMNRAENFSDWYEAAPGPAEMDQVREAWVDWLQKDATRWEVPTSLSDWRASEGDNGQKLHLWLNEAVFPHISTLPARQQVATWGAIVVSLRPNAQHSADYAQRLSELAKTVLPNLVQAVGAAGLTLHEPEWVGLRDSLKKVPRAWPALVAEGRARRVDTPALEAESPSPSQRRLKHRT